MTERLPGCSFYGCSHGLHSVRPGASAMQRLWTLLLLLALQPRTAAAEVLSYGYMAYVVPIAAEAPLPPPSPRYPMGPADQKGPGSSTPCPGDRSNRTPPETASRIGTRLRMPQPALLANAYAWVQGSACSPHCERLPYHATAPPSF